MHKLKILNSKEKKKLLNRINEHYGCDFSSGRVFLQDEKENLFLISESIGEIEFDKLKIERAGLFFGNGIMLSVEGSQLLGKVKKNLIELDEDEAKDYLKGEAIDSEIGDGDYILKSNGDYLGSAKARNGKILNSLPRNRRIS